MGRRIQEKEDTRMKCVDCGSSLTPAVTTYTINTPYRVEIKDLPCWKCQQCGEIYLVEESMKLIEQMEIKLGEIAKTKAKA
ncbi:MAG: YgiT-type zinc finger protein [Candidatus Hodarchaeales archaeon]